MTNFEDAHIQEVQFLQNKISNMRSRHLELIEAVREYHEAYSRVLFYLKHCLERKETKEEITSKGEWDALDALRTRAYNRMVNLAGIKEHS